jgi:hypothetical protein
MRIFKLTKGYEERLVAYSEGATFSESELIPSLRRYEVLFEDGDKRIIYAENDDYAMEFAALSRYPPYSIVEVTTIVRTVAVGIRGYEWRRHR